jgi:hypothetical protein
MQQSITQKDARITELENEVRELIRSLKLRKGANQIGSVAEFNDLKETLLTTQHELWRERLTSEALQTAHSRADMALAASLAVQKERADCIEQEYILASLKIKQLEESLRLSPLFLVVPSYFVSLCLSVCLCVSLSLSLCLCLPLSLVCLLPMRRFHHRQAKRIWKDIMKL